MRTIFQYLKAYVQAHFEWRLYLAVAAFAGLLIAVNYALDFEDGFIDQYFGSAIRIPLFFLVHGLAYYGALFMVGWLTGRRQWLYSRDFWIKSSLGLLVLCFHRSFHYHVQLRDYLPREIAVYTYRIAKYGLGWLTLLLPLLFLYLWYDRRESWGFYGLRLRGASVRPYLIMLAFVVPLAYLASLSPGFLKQYPMFKMYQGQGFADFFQTDLSVAIALFELAYLSAFLFVELFFRGFLILGMERYLGADVILPMVVTYAALHFGKPLGETVSSLFGGYILGVFALSSRNIWGGVFLHVGIASAMEFFAYLQKYG